MRAIAARIVLGLVGLCWTMTAAADVAIPELRSPVTDLTGTLDAPAREALESRLLAFQQQTGAQVAVLIVPTTQPEAIEQFSIRVVDAWKLGRAKVDDGVLLLVAKDDRALRIEVGQGLEGAIPDALSKRIIEEAIVPEFRAGHFSGGIDAGVDRILGLIRGEPLPAPVVERSSKPGISSIGPGLVVAALVVGGVLRAMLGRLVGASVAGAAGLLIGGLLFGWVVGVVAMLGLFFFTLLVEGNAGGVGGWGGGFGGGSGGGFSSGGGGFGGGGGGFSGGGASGRW